MTTPHPDPAQRWLLDETAVVAAVLSSNHRCARRARTVVGGIAVLLLAAGCSDPPQACTEIGATNGVNVTLEGLGTPDGLREVFVEACLSGTCGIQQVLDAESVFVELATIRSAAPVDLAITVRTDSGTVLSRAPRIPSTPRRVQPNGPGCDPTAYQAQVTIQIPMVPFSPPGSAGRA